MNKSIGVTRYVDDTKIYSKKNQYKVTAYKDILGYIGSASDTVGIGCDAWVIEEVSNRTATIEGYDTHCKIKEKTRIGNSVTTTTLPYGETVLIRVSKATILRRKCKYSTIHTTSA